MKSWEGQHLSPHCSTELHRSLPELLISNPAAREQEGRQELPTPTETTLSIHSSIPALRSSRLTLRTVWCIRCGSPVAESNPRILTFQVSHTPQFPQTTPSSLGAPSPRASTSPALHTTGESENQYFRVLTFLILLCFSVPW